MIAPAHEKRALDWHHPEAYNRITVLRCVNPHCGLEYVVYHPREFPRRCDRCRSGNFFVLYRYATY